MAIIPGEQKVASIETPQSKKNERMIYLLCAVILVTGFVAWYGFLRTPSEEEVVTPSPVIDEPKTWERIQKADLDNPIFFDKKFNDLILYGENPITVGTKGRPNPFEPF
jgi:hypothetical protein